MNPSVVDAIAEDDKPRTDFLKACLLKLGLQVNEQDQRLPSLSRIHLSSLHFPEVSDVLLLWKGNITLIDREKYIKAEIDTFHLEKPSSTWSMGTLTRAILDTLPSTETHEDQDKNDTSDMIVDYSQIVKSIVLHEDSLPATKQTPYFNHRAYFANREAYSHATRHESTQQAFGQPLLYGEVVTSTSTLLEKYGTPSLFSVPTRRQNPPNIVLKLIKT